MTSVRIHPQARSEILDAASTYETTRPGHGRLFVRQLDQAAGSIWQFPKRAPLILDDFRRVTLHRFPFCIIYRLRPAEIQILAVYPNRADPNKLLTRLMFASAS